MARIELRSHALEERVRRAVAEAILNMQEYKPRVLRDEPGSLVIETGSLGMAFLAAGRRRAEKMPMRVTVLMTGGQAGTTVAIAVETRGAGGAGGVVGMRKQRRGELFWLETVRAAIPDRTLA